MTKQKKKTAVVVVLAVVLVMVGLFVVFRLLFRPDDSQTILLPEPVAAVQEPATAPPAGGEDSPFVQVQPENLNQVLSTLTAPEAYYQLLTIRLDSETSGLQQTVEVWRREDSWRAKITTPDANQVRSILVLDDVTYIWQEGDTAPAKVDSAAVGFASLCALPDLQELLELPPDQVLGAKYVTLDRPDPTACFFVEAQRGAEGYTDRWWISQDSGLPVMLQRLENGTMFYAAQQEAFRILTPADEDYETAFAPPGQES